MRRASLCVFVAFVIVFSGCNGGTSAVAPPLNFSGTQSLDVGQSLNITSTEDVTWSLSGPGSLSGQTSRSVTYTAPASAAAAKRGANAPLASVADPTATVTATSVANTSKSTSLIINITSPPSITTTNLPAGTEGTAYNQTIAATGGAGTLTFSLSSGTLPAGLAMSSGGAITGTPTGPNVATNFTVKVTDSSAAGAQSATQALSITINLPPPPSITTTSLPNATEGTAYSQTIAASSGLKPYTFSIVVPGTGTLPAGLTISTGGVISGTPTGPGGTSNFTVKVTDSSNPNQSATQNLSITVVLPPPPSITTTSLPAGTEGTAYNQTVAATGGIAPYTFTVTGTLPAGLSMDTSGRITGTPAGPNGTASFTVNVKDSSNPSQTGSKGLSITINLPPAPVISPTSLPNGNVGTPYSQTLTVSGGLGPTFTWIVSSGSLPAGLTLTTNNPSSTAKISGTPTTAQNNVAFTIQVTDTSNPPQAGQQAYTVTISPPAPLVISTTSPLPNGAFNAAYSTTINATGGVAPYTFSLDAASSALPSGLTFTNDAVNNQGKISGTPTTAGMFTNIIVDVHDSEVAPSTATKTFTMTITAPAIVISPAAGSLPTGTVNSAYTTNITATGGVTPYTFSLDATSAALPAGLTFNSNATMATISGTPTATGTTNGIIVDVKDSESPAVTQRVTYSLTINAAGACASGGSESLLSGGYAFLLKGFDGSGNPVIVGGVLTFNGTNNNGLITAGAMDMNLSSGAQTNLTVTSGSYGVGSDHRGCMTITTSAGTQNYQFSLGNISGGAASTAHVIDFDTTGPFTAGVMRKQSGGPFSTSSVNGSFAFGGSSIQNSAQCSNAICGGKFAVAGVITFNGSGGISAGSEDINQNGILDGNPANTPWPATAITFNSTGSSYTMASNGRGTLTIAFVGANLISNNVVYAVSSSESFFMNIGPQATTGISAGQAFLQSGGPFSGSSLSGTYVGYTSALGSVAGTTATDLFLVNVSNPNITGTDTRNDGGTFTSGSIHSPTTYTVASNGRAVTTGGGHPAVLYIVNSNQAFALGSNGRVDSGFYQLQTGGPFTNSSASGAYAFGTIDPDDPTVGDNSGVATFTPATTMVSTINDSNYSGTVTPDQMNSFTYSVDSTGLVHGPSSCTVSATSTTCKTLIYIVSPTRAVVMDTSTATNPAIQVADQ